MRRLMLLFALVLTFLPLQGSAAQALYSSKGVMTWSTAQLDGYYRTLFALQGQAYTPPVVTILPAGETVHTACGSGGGESLAFYCSGDEQIVISEELVEALYEEDDFLPAYVLSHEWAHHAQHLSGTVPSHNPQEGDWDLVYTIENELRADCMSGVWMRSVAERGYLNATDMSAVLLKASEVGDSGIFGRGSSHGHGVERLRAVFLGYEEGIMGCMGITPLPRTGSAPTVTPSSSSPY
jgi:predicted metalloprotease